VSGRICIALHDVAPATWPACARLLALLDELGAPPLTLLVVPDYHHRGRVDLDVAFRRAIDVRLARGDEVALHGCFHLDDAPAPRDPVAWFHRRVLTKSEGEFAALDAGAAAERLAHGLHAFACCDWPVRGFVAPAWLLGEGARVALARSTLEWTSTRTHLESLTDQRRLGAPAVSASTRNRWRRRASLAWLALAARATRRRALVRAALHPADAAHADLVDGWRALLQTLLSQREALTKTAAFAAPPMLRGRPLPVHVTADQSAQAAASAR
jgi:predicted deacetylase